MKPRTTEEIRKITRDSVMSLSRPKTRSERDQELAEYLADWKLCGGWG